jgi:hypothetical protein
MAVHTRAMLKPIRQGRTSRGRPDRADAQKSPIRMPTMTDARQAISLSQPENRHICVARWRGLFHNRSGRTETIYTAPQLKHRPLTTRRMA